MMTVRSRLLGALVLCVFGPACGDDAPSVPASECIPGEYKLCECDNSVRGFATCDSSASFDACYCEDTSVTRLPFVEPTKVASIVGHHYHAYARVGDHLLAWEGPDVVELDESFAPKAVLQSCASFDGTERFHTGGRGSVSWLCYNEEFTSVRVSSYSEAGQLLSTDAPRSTADLVVGGDGFAYIAANNFTELHRAAAAPGAAFGQVDSGGYGLRATSDGVFWMDMYGMTLHTGGGDPFVSTVVDPMVHPLGEQAFKVDGSWYFASTTDIRRVSADGFGEEEILHYDSGANPYSGKVWLEPWSDHVLVVLIGGALLRVDARDNSVAALWTGDYGRHPVGFSFESDGSLMFLIGGEEVWKSPANGKAL